MSESSTTVDHQRSDGTNDHLRKVFVGGLSNNTNADGLRKFFEKFGQVEDCMVMKDPFTGYSRRFGFVTFGNASEVDNAMAGRPHEIDGRLVDTKRALPREDRGPNISTSRLFVSGVREGITEQMLSEYFARYGKVEKTSIVCFSDGHPRGFAFVFFDDYDPVDKAVLERFHTIGDTRVECKKGLSKEELHKQRLNQINAERRDSDRTGRCKRDARGVLRTLNATTGYTETRLRADRSDSSPRFAGDGNKSFYANNHRFTYNRNAPLREEVQEQPSYGLLYPYQQMGYPPMMPFASNGQQQQWVIPPSYPYGYQQPVMTVPPTTPASAFQSSNPSTPQQQQHSNSSGGSDMFYQQHTQPVDVVYSAVTAPVTPNTHGSSSYSNVWSAAASLAGQANQQLRPSRSTSIHRQIPRH